ncbi:GNAT family N-acetyltransferase [Taibaiella lutea]|nr:GNAT family N-acetyltransferase [Taibaiella lutea]
MTQDIQYRKAVLSDAKKLSILYKQVYIQTYGIEGVSDEFANFITKQFAVERLENIIQSNPDSVIVAAHKNNLVGVAEIEFDKKAPVNGIAGPELNKLYILEWFCGRGIGYRLLMEAEQTVLSKGDKWMWLWVLDSNNRAIRFYERQQYEPKGKATFQMEHNKYENIVMMKQLKM